MCIRDSAWLARGFADFAACWRQSVLYGLGLLGFGLLVLWLSLIHISEPTRPY